MSLATDQKSLLNMWQLNLLNFHLYRASDRVRKKVKIVRDFGGKLCRTKS